MTGALAGLRVVDVSHYLAGPQVAMMLGDLGADVIRIDPPSGPRWNHPANAMLQRGKRSIALDLSNHADRGLAQRLIAHADVVIENFRPGVATRLGIGPDSSIADNPGLVYCSIPGFAEADPRAEVRAWEGVICAAAGIYVSGTMESSGDPVFNAIPYASSFGAMVAAHTTMAALIARERSGLGQRIEVPLFEAVFEAVGHFGVHKPGGGEPMTPAAFGALAGTSPHGGYYQCADGEWINVCLLQARHLQWFAAKFFPPEWVEAGLADPLKMGAVDADPMAIAGKPLHKFARECFTKLFASKSAREWEAIINEEVGAPTALCQSTEVWLLDDDHARAAQAVVEVEDHEFGRTVQAGFPIMLSETPPTVSGPRRPLDADRVDIIAELEDLEARSRPTAVGSPITDALGEMKVVDVSQVLAGPTATRILAEYGAEVINVMSPYDGQVLAHQYTNNGKPSIVLDLQNDEGKAIYRALAAPADVVQENFTYGVADRMAIGEEQLRKLNPDLVYSTLSAYGRGGRRGTWRGREELGQAVTGMAVRWGAGGRPRMQPFPAADYGAGNCSAFGILVATYHRLRTGVGQHVHTSLAHACTFHQLPYMITYPGFTPTEPSGQDALGWSACDRLYHGSDRWFYLAALNSGDLQRLSEVVGAPEAESQTADELARAFASATADEWVERLSAAGIAAHTVMTINEVMADPVTKSRGLSLMKEFPEIGVLQVVGPSPRLASTPPRPGFPVGPPGAEGQSVLARIGMSDDFERLVQQGAVRTSIADGVQLVGRVQIRT
jgi:crotonobetainyl-CoA:carnitine CoA-transferase CaiB-like acyl-CoA transferase